MSYKKLGSEGVSTSNATSSQSAISAPKSTLKQHQTKPLSENTASIKAQLQKTKNMTKEKEPNIIKTEASPKLTIQDHDLAFKLAKGAGDEHNQSQSLPVEFINNLNENKDILQQNNVQSNCGHCKNRMKCLCGLLQRDYITFIASPIVLCILLIIMLMINSNLIIVWLLSVLIFYCLLIFSYFYVSGSGTDSILDLFTLSMTYGGFMGVIGWIFGWMLAETNNISLGPFIFMHSGFILSSTANTVLFGIVACIMYGGIFPFVLIWLKSDKRLIDQCFSAKCKIANFNILDEYQALQQSLNLPEHQIEQFIASNEKEIMLKLETAQKTLQMECVSSVVGYVGSIYILSFLLKFDSMNMLDSTLIFVYGYLLKDFIFGVLFAIIASYIVGRRRLYQVRMNNKCVYYVLIMILGILQQSISTVLCGLYPNVGLRMDIVYVSIGFNVIICIMAVIEIYHQRKVFMVQLDALFIYNSINNLQISESSVRMDNLSLTTITE